MIQFVQIGDFAINIAAIASIQFFVSGGESITRQKGVSGVRFVYLDGSDSFLYGAQCEAFRDWWTHKAPVYEVSVYEEAEE